MIVETVRLSEKAKNQLIQVKRKTGIDQWNVLCRWALILSLSEKHSPPNENFVTDSSVEIGWKTFSGSLDSVVTGLVKYQYEEQKSNDSDFGIENFFKSHLHRGISYLNQNVKENVVDLIRPQIIS